LVVEVNEGAGWVTWERRENLLYYFAADGRAMISDPDARDYTVQFDENDNAWVIFGDGVYGLRPPVGANNIRATYRVGGGAAGNVPTGTIKTAKTAIPLLDSVVNPQAAAGGSDSESIEHGVRFGPLAFRSGQRAVTLSDFTALAQQAGGVAKVRAQASGWNRVDLYIAPEGDTCRPAPEALKKRILAFFEDRRMASTVVRIQDPLAVPVDVSVEVVLDAHYPASAVREQVAQAIGSLLAFQNVDFGQALYLSAVYGATETLPGVVAITVTRFRRQDRPGPSAELLRQLDQLNLANAPGVQDMIRQSLSVDVEADGRIEIGDLEIPTPGDLEITLKDNAG
jgi:predicted phage baseplate assembly protein